MIAPEDRYFDAVLEIVSGTVGIDLPEAHIPAVKRYLKDRQEHLNISDMEYLESVQTDPAELEKLINNVMIDETYFFREEKQFQLLLSHVFPQLDIEHPLRFWSAACSTGEEAVSLALISKNYFPDDHWKNLTVFATDINSDNLAEFDRGYYDKYSIKTDGGFFRHLLNLDKDSNFLLKDIFKDHIKISRLNLYTDDVSDFPEYLDLVFFRNTLIYYNRENKQKLLNNVISRLKPEGFLFVSASEVPFVPLTEMELLEQNNIYYFQKKRE